MSKHKKTSLFLTVTIAIALSALAAMAQKAQPGRFDHVEPPFWWVGMKDNRLQILFHNRTQDISNYTVEAAFPGVQVSEVRKVSNPHYLFVIVEIAQDAKPGTIPFVFRQGKRSFTWQYELRDRRAAAEGARGFNSSDVVYLIMPDRFANGDESNDAITGMFEGVNRNEGFARHGGDLQGIMGHMDYIQDLGVTAIWLNPVLENNQQKQSYHGYAITDLYNVDRRFGGNSAYIAFINECHKRGLKVIQDMVMNHIGNEHWLVTDPPENDWIHQFPEFTRSNYRLTTISDPYRSQSDQKLATDGWFDTTMPDVNQRNELFATYLIQNTLWWIAYAGIDGIRMDTYPYPDKEFMATWMQAVMKEFPDFNVVGEVWLDNIATTAYWQKGMVNKDGYQSHLPTVTDFPLSSAIHQALNEPGGWSGGLAKIYNVLSQDFIYPNAENNLVFVDNHDVTRFFRICGRDLKKFKMGLTFLLTTRGIPQLYYGTELLMDGDGAHHPDVRRDVPGGWKGDSRNAFTREGRSQAENEAFDFLKALLTWRKNEGVIHKGKLTHYIPQENIYVYFRHNDDKTVMVILNGNPDEKAIDTRRFSENIKGFTAGKDVVTGKSWSLGSLSIPGWESLVLELR